MCEWDPEVIEPSAETFLRNHLCLGVNGQPVVGGAFHRMVDLGRAFIAGSEISCEAHTTRAPGRNDAKCDGTPEVSSITHWVDTDRPVAGPARMLLLGGWLARAGEHFPDDEIPADLFSSKTFWDSGFADSEGRAIKGCHLTVLRKETACSASC